MAYLFIGHQRVDDLNIEMEYMVVYLNNPSKVILKSKHDYDYD